MISTEYCPSRSANRTSVASEGVSLAQRNEEEWRTSCFCIKYAAKPVTRRYILPLLGQSSSAVKITVQDRSVLDLKLQRDKLKQYQRRIEVVLAREREIAAESLKAGNKQRALTALRQKKYQETLLSQTDAQLETLQKLVQSIEFSLVEKDVLFGLQQGNDVLKQLNKEMDLATVEKLMDDTREGIAYQQEVSELLSSRMSAQDEEDVQAELAALQAEQSGTKLPEAPTHALPEVERPAVSVPFETEARPEERHAERRQAVAA
ncbi:Vacuolar protein sorting-associated protein 20 [Rhodotorula toruloides]